jgi:outer membrane protein OmpA-like peptidoglycan-associated protein
MKPLSAKNRKDVQDTQQLDFLSSIPAPVPPMKPLEPSQDGTLPLPLSHDPVPAIPPRPIFPTLHKEPTQPVTPVDPVEDVFESDPFFNPPQPIDHPAEEEQSIATPEPDAVGSTPDDIPFEIDNTDPVEAEEHSIEPPTPDPILEADEPVEPAVQEQAAPEPAAQVHPTAEERLLGSIVNEPPAKRNDTQSRLHEDQLNHLRTELDSAMEVAYKAAASRDKSQKELHTLKTRFEAMETELAAVQATLTHANQLRAQTEARFTEAEKQWTDKLNHLRHLLDEVEDTRDEVSQKKVSKLLFIGTVITSIIAIPFAYLIGANQSGTQDSSEPPAVTAPAIPPPAPPMDGLRAPPSPAVTHESQVSAPPPAPILNTGASATAPSPMNTPKPKSPAIRVAEKTPDWPTLTGNRWTTATTAKEMKVVFSYGLFTSGSILTATAKEDLSAIAANLKGTPFRLEIVGHTDPEKAKSSKGSDNQAVGLARAKAVASYLTSSCGLPSSMLSTSSAGENNPPHPNSTPANQKKNRTVVLKITAK